jgi:hypothetical protein
MSAGYDRLFEVAQDGLANHQVTASAAMQRELVAQMFTVCADVINILDPQIRLVQMNQVDSKSATAAQITRLRESEKQYNAHLHELVEIADQRGAMESIWHGYMELNQTYMNDYTALMLRITKLKQIQSGAGQVPRSCAWKLRYIDLDPHMAFFVLLDCEIYV